MLAAVSITRLQHSAMGQFLAGFAAQNKQLHWREGGRRQAVYNPTHHRHHRHHNARIPRSSR